MILVDTSIWIDHFRHGHEPLRKALEKKQVLMHPFVIGEIACGCRPSERGLLDEIDQLPHVVQVRHEEALAFLVSHDLAGSGMGWIDIHLLASARLARCSLLTGDKAMRQAAEQVGVEAFS